MTPESVCWLCFMADGPMHDITDSPLRNIYEKLTDISIQAGDSPVTVCYFCHSQLKNSRALMTKAKTAYKLLKAKQESGVVVNRESMAMVNREDYKLSDGLSITHSEIIVIDPRRDIKLKNEDETSSCDGTAMKSEVFPHEEKNKRKVLHEVKKYKRHNGLINRKDRHNKISEQTENALTKGLEKGCSIHNNYINNEISESIEELELPLNLVINKASLPTVFTCEYCSSEFKTENLLKEHIAKNYTIIELKITGDKKRPYTYTVKDML